MKSNSTTAIFLGEVFVLRDGVLAAVIGSNLCGRAGGGRQWEDEARAYTTAGQMSPPFSSFRRLPAARFRFPAVIFGFAALSVCSG